MKKNSNPTSKRVDGEINRLLKERNIEKISKTNDNVFIQPTVITVKKDRTVKLASDARALNQAIDNDNDKFRT